MTSFIDSFLSLLLRAGLRRPTQNSAHFRDAQLAPLSDGQATQSHRPDLDAHQPQHLVPDRLQHPPNLPVTPLAQDELQGARPLSTTFQRVQTRQKRHPGRRCLARLAL
jgi:hypothetical protein